MKKNLFGRGTVMILLLVVAFSLGQQSHKEDISLAKDKEEETQTEVQKEASRVIAVVNLDEGVTKQEQKLNYGSTLINLLSSDLKVTSLEDARKGIESGIYGAYFIIPNDFSNNVETISTKPVKSKISYALSPNLTGNDRAEVVSEVQEIYNTFNDQIGEVYLSSILKDYHQVQDDASAIMKRDTEDMQALLNIQSHNLVEIIAIPEVKMVEKNIEPLNVEASFSANSALVEDIDMSYKGFLQAGQDGLGTIKGKSVDVLTGFDDSEALNRSLKDITGKVNALESAVRTDAVNNHNTTYNTLKASIPSDLNALLTHYANAEAMVSQGVQNLDVSNVVLEADGSHSYTYNTYSEAQYNALLNFACGLIIANDSSLTQQQAQAQIKAQLGQNDATPITLNKFDAPISNSKIHNLQKAVNDLIAAGDGSRELVDGNLSAQVSALQSSVNDLTIAVTDLKTKQSTLNQELTDYNILSHVDNDVISTHVSSMKTVNSELEGTVSKQNSQYEEYSQKVYETTNENITQLQKSIQEGQESSEKKLEEGLSAAKISRSNSNQNNIAALEAFSSKLAYTRVGELENKEVYNFVVNPFIIDNQSAIVPDTTVSKASVGGAFKEKKTEEGTSFPWFWLVIAGVILVPMIGGYLIRMKQKKAKQQDEL